MLIQDRTLQNVTICGSGSARNFCEAQIILVLGGLSGGAAGVELVKILSALGNADFLISAALADGLLSPVSGTPSWLRFSCAPSCSAMVAASRPRVLREKAGTGARRQDQGQKKL